MHISRHLAWPTVVALLALYATLAWTSVRQKCTTFDEIAHLTAGYSFWTTGDYRLNPENGVLPQRWAALPLLVMDLHFPDTNQPAWQRSDVWVLGYQFFYTLENDLDRMLWWSRGMIVLLGVALAAVVYTWSRRLFGTAGGIVSLTLCALSPSLLAHGRLVTSDMAATLAFLISLGTFWIVLHRVNPLTVLTSSLAMGLLFVCKMSAALIVPTALVLVAIRLVVGRPLIVGGRREEIVVGRWQQLPYLGAAAIVHAVAVVAMIWAAFGFHFAAFRESQPDRDQMLGGQTIESLTEDSSLGPAIRLARDWRLLPEPYLHGFAYVAFKSASRSAFFNGEYGTTGWKTFFPYCLMVKTPLAVFVVLLAAGAAAVARWTDGRVARRRQRSPFWHRARQGLYRTAPLWVLLAVYWSVAIFTHLNIGHRHILPTYPLMFVLCGAAGYWLVARRKLIAGVVVVALAWMAVESVRIYPDYLAYFNQLAGGPSHGYQHLVDSSLDWGQDLPGLKQWLTRRASQTGSDEPAYLSYFGTGSPQYYGSDVIRLPGYMDWRQPRVRALNPGTYCISATMLQCVYLDPPGPWNAEYEQNYQEVRRMATELSRRLQQDPALARRLQDPAGERERAQWNLVMMTFDRYRLGRLCAYLRRRVPDDSVGYSILIYHLTADDLNRAQNQPWRDWE